ncbi:hypothetical protein BT96DRAFT_1026013 [Gymnopus androsaceus JB14]|uniref:NAD-specific glutamate dehydrogenase second domain-containing protein n=1 Tax=Gymnopus androsaceus JB14 TaxID=1447944 RepID=A0A6A4GNQ9_9AGAR|nr:hypothetical protein BT96DRAFT_1026013 [Gymnopus androsaceus JB14]
MILIMLRFLGDLRGFLPLSPQRRPVKQRKRWFQRPNPRQLQSRVIVETNDRAVATPRLVTGSSRYRSPSRLSGYNPSLRASGHSLSLLNPGLSLIDFLKTNRPNDEERSCKLGVDSKKIVVKHCTVGTIGFVARNNGDGLPVFKVKEVQRAIVQQQFAAKPQSQLVLDESRQRIDENGNGATFIHTSPPGITITEEPGATCKSRIDTCSSTAQPQMLSRQQVCLSGQPCHKGREGRNVSDKSFLEKASEKRSCGALSNGTVQSWRFSKSRARERDVLLSDTRWAGLQPSLGRVTVCLSLSTNLYTSALSNLYHFYSLYSARKYVEQFSNGVIIISVYLNPVPTPRRSNTPSSRSGRLHFCSVSPKTRSFSQRPQVRMLFRRLHTLLDLCTTLLQQARPGLLAAQNVLDKNDPAHAEVLNNIKRRFRKETFTRESIEQVIHTRSELIQLLYVDFAMVYYPASDHATELMPTLSYQRLQTIQPLSDEELYDKIRRTVPNKHSLQVLESFLIFNKHILKTNFHQPTKVALSFRLDPGFLPEVEYVEAAV